MAAYLGMRGSGNFVANSQPSSWRETILRLYPNGDAPLTAILSMMASRQVDDPVFHWWEKGLPTQEGAVTGVYTDATLSVAVTQGTLANGDVVYLKVAQDVASEFRFGHQVLMQRLDDVRYEQNGKVIARVLAGANSYLAVKLIHTPVNIASHDLDYVNYVAVAGNSNPEGATMPDAITYDPVERSNYTQIFRTPLSITRTARRTRLRTGDAYKEAKREALELHAIEMEKAAIWGRKSLTTGHNGKPERTTDGIISMLRQYAPENIVDFRRDADFTGDTWAVSGKAWLDKVFANLGVYGSRDKLALRGSNAGLGLTTLVEAGAQINVSPGTLGYGIDVETWSTGAMKVHMKDSPLFSQSATYNNAILIIEPARMGFPYIDDTFFVEDPEDRKNRNNSKDGTEEEFITEGGFEYSHIRTAMLLTGIGEDA